MLPFTRLATGEEEQAALYLCTDQIKLLDISGQTHQAWEEGKTDPEVTSGEGRETPVSGAID
jgi:hypothetical protein